MEKGKAWEQSHRQVKIMWQSLQAVALKIEKKVNFLMEQRMSLSYIYKTNHHMERHLLVELGQENIQTLQFLKQSCKREQNNTVDQHKLTILYLLTNESIYFSQAQ